VIQSLSAATAAGAHGTGGDFGVPAPGTVVAQVPGTSPMPRAWPIGVAVTAGTITAGSVQLEGSLDGLNWYPVGAVVSLGTGGTFTLPATGTPPTPARYVRVSIVAAVTGGGTVSAWVDAAP
jgi:hypothetical protein